MRSTCAINVAAIVRLVAFATRYGALSISTPALSMELKTLSSCLYPHRLLLFNIKSCHLEHELLGVKALRSAALAHGPKMDVQPVA